MQRTLHGFDEQLANVELQDVERDNILPGKERQVGVQSLIRVVHPSCSNDKSAWGYLRYHKKGPVLDKCHLAGKSKMAPSVHPALVPAFLVMKFSKEEALKALRSPGLLELLHAKANEATAEQSIRESLAGLENGDEEVQRRLQNVLKLFETKLEIDGCDFSIRYKRRNIDGAFVFSAIDLVKLAQGRRDANAARGICRSIFKNYFHRNAHVWCYERFVDINDRLSKIDTPCVTLHGAIELLILVSNSNFAANVRRQIVNLEGGDMELFGRLVANAGIQAHLREHDPNHPLLAFGQATESRGVKRNFEEFLGILQARDAQHAASLQSRDAQHLAELQTIRMQLLELTEASHNHAVVELARGCDHYPQLVALGIRLQGEGVLDVLQALGHIPLSEFLRGRLGDNGRRRSLSFFSKLCKPRLLSWCRDQHIRPLLIAVQHAWRPAYFAMHRLPVLEATFRSRAFRDHLRRPALRMGRVAPGVH